MDGGKIAKFPLYGIHMYIHVHDYCTKSHDILSHPITVIFASQK